MQRGTVVLPVGNSTNEVIIGIVLGREDERFWNVGWLSDRRGAFMCTEGEVDLIAAPLDERNNEMSDPFIDHEDIAVAMDDSWQCAR